MLTNIRGVPGRRTPDIPWRKVAIADGPLARALWLQTGLNGAPHRFPRHDAPENNVTHLLDEFRHSKSFFNIGRICAADF